MRGLVSILIALGIVIFLSACSDPRGPGDTRHDLQAVLSLTFGLEQVEVAVENRTVLLTGAVPYDDLRRRAERIARRHAPAYAVVNRIVVRPEDRPPRRYEDVRG
jgi:hypothetical protein